MTVSSRRRSWSYAGALCLLAHQPRATTLVAATPLETLIISDREFSTLLHELPEVADCLHADIGRATVAGLETAYVA
jgi:hypothetical protein